jgi:hypothetical protein
VISANNRVYKNPDGKVWLELAEAPVTGSRRRFLGFIRGGVFEIERAQSHWHKNFACWYVNLELVSNHKQYGFDVVFLFGTDGNGKKHNGWVAAEELLRIGRTVRYRSTGYEGQIALEPSMLKDLRAEAERAAEPEKRPLPEPEPQMALFAIA